MCSAKELLYIYVIRIDYFFSSPFFRLPVEPGNENKVGPIHKRSYYQSSDFNCNYIFLRMHANISPSKRKRDFQIKQIKCKLDFVFQLLHICMCIRFESASSWLALCKLHFRGKLYVYWEQNFRTQINVEKSILGTWLRVKV